MGSFDVTAFRLCGRESSVHSLPALQRPDPPAGAETLRLGRRQAVGSVFVLGAVPDRDCLPASARWAHGVRGARRDRACSLRGAGPRLARLQLQQCAVGGGPPEAVCRPLGGCLAALHRRVRRATRRFDLSVQERFVFRPEPPLADARVSVREWRRWGSRLRPMLLPDRVRAIYRELRESDRTTSLGSLADVGIGYVSGVNDFFRRRWRHGAGPENRFGSPTRLRSRDPMAPAFAARISD